MRQALLVLLAPVLRVCTITDGNSEADRGKRNTNERLSKPVATKPEDSLDPGPEPCLQNQGSLAGTASTET